MKDKNNRNNNNKIIEYILLLIFILSISISIFLIFKFFNGQDKTIQQLDHQIEEVEKKSTKGTLNYVKKDKEKPLDSTEIFKNIDWNYLYKTNSDTVGWIEFLNDSDLGNINYPLVQTTNNDYYLYQPFTWDSDKEKDGLYKQENLYGTIFVNYRNNKDFNDISTTIYGHSFFYHENARPYQFTNFRKFLTDFYSEEDVEKVLENKKNYQFRIYVPNAKDVEKFKSGEDVTIRTEKINIYHLYSLNIGRYDSGLGGNLELPDEVAYNLYINKVTNESLYKNKIVPKDEDMKRIFEKRPNIINLYTCAEVYGSQRIFYNAYLEKTIDLLQNENLFNNKEG